MTEDQTERDAWPWVAVICGYFLFQVAWRRLLGGGLGLDEAQIFLWGQHLAWGYGPQPPLYSWLQRAALAAIPDPLLALSLLKNALLATTYLAVYALLRSAHPRDVAGLAALCLFLMPQISWDSQRDMTHSVLVVTLAALTTLVFWRRTLAGRPGGWAAFGVAVGLGALGKVNFLLVPASLLLAAASMPSLRPGLRPAGLALAAAIFAAIVALPAWWAWQNLDLALASAAELQPAASGAPPWRPALAGTAALAAAVASCLALAALVFGLLLRFRRRPGAGGGAPGELDRLLLRSILIGLALVLAGVIATRTTHVRDIWLLPVLCLAIPLAAVRLQPRIDARGVRILRRVIAGLAVLVTVALGVHMRYGDPGHPTIRRAPVVRIAAELEARFPAADRIVADPEWLAGNLIYRRPDLAVVSALDPGPAPAAGEAPVLVWWNGKPTTRERLARDLGRAWGVPVEVGAPVTLAAPFPPQPDVAFRVEAAPITVGAAPARR